MIIGFTGHRPNSLPGTYSHHTYLSLMQTVDFIVRQYQPKAVISGMALGFDTAVSEIALHHGIDLIAAVPCPNQDGRWRDGDREKYRHILSLAKDVQVISPSYSPQAMQLRNQWIVDRCDILMALCNRSSGGTQNCISYAVQVDRPTFNCWGTFMHFYNQC